MKKIIMLFCVIVSLKTYSQTPTQLFDKTKMEYKGSKIEQAELLLRNVKMWAEIDKRKPNIDLKFQNLINSVIEIKKEQLKTYLQSQSIFDDEICGSIDNEVSFTIVDKNKIYAKYFVIHDVSSPAYENKFPKNINDSTWVKNKLSSWSWKKGKKPSHSIITRTGKSKTLNNFSVGWRATKFELNVLGISSRGLFIHIELVQPRVFPPGNSTSAPVAPTPGFTDIQYQRLALLYICASVRKGDWLIPAYHVNIDEGLKDGHDDPQNFELNKFTDKVLELNKLIQNK